MKSNPSLMKSLVGGFLIACLCVGIARAQAVNPVSPVAHGRFILPLEVQCGHTVLPAGEYSFTLESKSLPAVVIIRGGRKSVVIAAAGVSQHDSSGFDALVVSSNGEKRAVRAIQLASIGLVISYSSAKSKSKEPAQRPETTELIAMSAVGR